MKRIASLVLASVFGGALALGGYMFINQTPADNGILKSNEENPKVFQTNYIPTSKASLSDDAIDFRKAAEETVNAVVHVKNKAVPSSNLLEEFFFGRSRNSGQRRIVGTGSGVIISPDGYIITNNHVIRGAEDIEVTLNNQKSYTAEVIGTHERSDIALLKINDTDLPFVPFANSDNIQIGEWVLAVGNPFNLTSTVTAGIVSAKGRDIDISSNRMIESFIQTDAAVNPGNSGGALVNVRGELVGINTAITSQTGSYVGYSFAVPSNIAKKVVEDIMEFGDVQTAYIGIGYAELGSEQAKQFDTNGITEGVLVTSLTANGGAKAAGIQPNDIITKLDNIKVSRFSDMQGYLSSKRPGEVVDVKLIRNGVEKDFRVTLANQFGKTTVDKFDFTNNYIGSLKKISKKDASKYRINYGVEILGTVSGRLKEQGVSEGDIILKVNDTKVYKAEDVEAILRKNKGREVLLQVLNDEGYAEYVRTGIQN
ncbi:MAG: trypsin-like peptidase domain-containing protein [Flavobacteriaceae bacterium]|nr:trypsin-like peptidase domain-containing protein [Flavobacteriaceae bacterium]